MDYMEKMMNEWKSRLRGISVDEDRKVSKGQLSNTDIKWLNKITQQIRNIVGTLDQEINSGNKENIISNLDSLQDITDRMKNMFK